MKRTWSCIAAILLMVAAPAGATVSTTTSVVEYICTGTLGTFSVPFRFLDQTHLRVSKVLIASPFTETVLTLTTDYSVGGAGVTGGTVALVTPASSCPSSSYKLRVRRLTPRTQGTPFSTQGSFNPRAHEAAFDRQTMIAQELNDGAAVSTQVFSFGGPDASAGAVTAAGSTTPRPLASRFSDVVNVMDYGCAANGIADDRTCVQNAFNVGGRVYVPPGTYKIGSAISIPSNLVVQGAGQNKTILQRAFTGDFITSQGAASSLYDLTIDGQTSTYGSGRGILILTGASGQQHHNIAVKNFVQSCLEFAQDGGSDFVSIGSTYYTTGATGKVAAVKTTGVDTQAIPRKFFAPIGGGCTLFDFGGVNHFWASGFYTNGLIFSSPQAFNVELRQVRIGAINLTKGSITAGSTSLALSAGTGTLFAVGDGVSVWGAGATGGPLVAKISGVATDTLTLDLAATTTVTAPGPACGSSNTAGCVARADVFQGDSHIISGISAQGAVYSTTGSEYGLQTPSWAFREVSGSGNRINIGTPSFWASTLTASGSTPTLGNGSLLSRWTRTGRRVSVNIEFTFGSTSTAGTGTWQFSLPQAALNVGGAEICGSAYIQNGAGSVTWTGTPRVVAGASVLTVYYGAGGAAAVISATTPFAWDTGAVLRLNCEYSVP